jgi:exodeoxyribonuclease-5
VIAEIILTDEQEHAVNMAVDTINDGGMLFKIGGYAGTGKTTVAKSIVEQLNGVISCAFTGKAAYRLREKGLSNTSTIHRAIYKYDASTMSFELKDDEDIEGHYFLVDEGSMVSGELWRDLTSFGMPLILLGDPGQLEPIGSDPALMREPDVILQRIHRQAAGSGIIQFATNVRLCTHQPGMEYSNVEIFRGHRPSDSDLFWADIVLCGYNRTRHRLNKTVRRLRGLDGLLCVGERIIILRNNYDYGVFNGQILTVESIQEQTTERTLALCSTDDGITLPLPLFNDIFGGKTNPFYDTSVVMADYGYCITCHKSQGSEWDNVIVIDEQCPKWDATRWRYTAITRAAENLKYFVQKPSCPRSENG